MATRFYKVGTEVKVQTTYIDPVTFAERTRVKHGIVTAVTSQDRLTARVGRTSFLVRRDGHVFTDRNVASSARQRVVPMSAGS